MAGSDHLLTFKGLVIQTLFEPAAGESYLSTCVNVHLTLEESNLAMHGLHIW
jgi:hypothetical protein